MHLPSRQRGFSLIEVLAAFLIFVLAFGVTLEILSASMRNATRSAESSYAALWAQSKLDLVGVGESLEPGSDEGRFDDEYRWQLEIREYEVERDPGTVDIESPIAVELFEVELIVLWGEPGRERQARFVTLRSSLPRNQL